MSDEPMNTEGLRPMTALKLHQSWEQIHQVLWELYGEAVQSQNMDRAGTIHSCLERLQERSALRKLALTARAMVVEMEKKRGSASE
jgi:hypothetical protein